MDDAFDIIVVGSGAAGLAAAVTAAASGARVVVLEKADLIGGTSAMSGGEIWIPRSRQALEAGIIDDAGAVVTYIREVAGIRYDSARSHRFIESAPEALAFLERKGGLRYALMPGSPDYRSELPGACAGGRSLAAEPFDGRLLGSAFEAVRPPLENALIAGGASVCTRLDLPRLVSAGRNPGNAVYAAKLVASAWRDRLAGRSRGTRMTNGNALVGRLLLALQEAGVDVRLRHEVTGLIVSGGRVEGVDLLVDGAQAALTARAAVILAAGGFSHSEVWKRSLFPHVRHGGAHVSLPPATNSGAALDIGRAIGAAGPAAMAHPAAWAPVSNVPRGHGRTAPWPHFGDKGKPGVIAVDVCGRRFVNEADSYHDFVAALLDGQSGSRPPAAWLVADHRALRAYGLGAVRPFPWPIGRHLRWGYLLRGRTVRELAGIAGLDGDGLEQTVAEFNRNARIGQDPQFGRGESLFNRRSGDPDWQPNPALGPLVEPPFYALKVVPGDIGTFAGLATDEFARVLDGAANPIDGLYAVGNDAASLFGGDYPAAGITLGPALTFGYVAARHALGEGWPANSKAGTEGGVSRAAT
jgi:succinate dehydrogenase/fumarate reductase flavoprotein subunit